MRDHRLNYPFLLQGGGHHDLKQRITQTLQQQIRRLPHAIGGVDEGFASPRRRLLTFTLSAW